jgi:hypothetical protein
VPVTVAVPVSVTVSEAPLAVAALLRLATRDEISSAMEEAPAEASAARLETSEAMLSTRLLTSPRMEET